MIEIVHYHTCPLCGDNKLQIILEAKDHTVSHQLFKIVQCYNCSLRITQDLPAAAHIGDYYQSDQYISHSDTDRGFINKLYHIVRKRTLARKRKLVQKSTGIRKGNLLEIGSGTGAFLKTMKEEGWSVTGLEPDEGARNIAKRLYDLSLSDTGSFPDLPPAHYNAITLWHVLEHVHELHYYVQQLKTLLTDEGRIFIAVPNYTSADAKIYKQFWAAYDVPRHLYHFSPRSMELLMSMHGLKVLGIKPMWYDSFYISLLSSKYKNGQTNWPAAFWNGMRSNLGAVFNRKKCSSVIYVIGKK
jgi:2-polyprenyl-3-methyl-5-hydroxy-6-metoxy-1,4-benzoquinol methylase